MPNMKRRRSTRRVGTRVTTATALHKRLVQIQAAITALKRERVTVKRIESDGLIWALRQVQQNTDALSQHADTLATQFTRIAQLQMEVDELRRALKKATLLD